MYARSLVDSVMYRVINAAAPAERPADAAAANVLLIVLSVAAAATISDSLRRLWDVIHTLFRLDPDLYTY